MLPKPPLRLVLNNWICINPIRKDNRTSYHPRNCLQALRRNPWMKRWEYCRAIQNSKVITGLSSLSLMMKTIMLIKYPSNKKDQLLNSWLNNKQKYYLPGSHSLRDAIKSSVTIYARAKLVGEWIKKMLLSSGTIRDP